MKKQRMGIVKIIFNTEKTFLEKFTQNLPSVEPIEILASFTKIEKTCTRKITQPSTQCEDGLRPCGGGAAV